MHILSSSTATLTFIDNLSFTKVARVLEMGSNFGESVETAPVAQMRVTVEKALVATSAIDLKEKIEKWLFL